MFREQIIVFLLSAVPFIELRGSIPLGIALEVPPLNTLILAIVGSLLPAPILLNFLEPIFQLLKKIKIFHDLVFWTIRRALKKSEKIQKYSLLGLVFLVAVPLPSTGVWTGCIAASLVGLSFKQAFPAVALGTSIAGLIVLSLSVSLI